MYKDIASLDFFLVSLIDDTLRNSGISVYYLSSFDLLRQLNYISSSTLESFLLLLLPTSSVDVTKLGLSLKI